MFLFIEQHLIANLKHHDNSEKKTIEERNKLLILVLLMAHFSCTLNKGPALSVCTKPPIAYSWQWPWASYLNGSLCLWHDLRKTEACPWRIRTVSFGAPLTKSWKLRLQMGYTFKIRGPSMYVPCCSCNKWENTATAAASGISRLITHWERERSIWWWWRETVVPTYLRATPRLKACPGAERACQGLRTGPACH